MPGPEGTSDLASALALSDAGDHLGALAIADRILALEPGSVEAHIARGWALENLGLRSLPDARAAYTEALRLDPDALWAKEGLSNVLRRLGHPVEADALAAEVVARALALAERDADVLELQGWCEFKLGRLEDAEATFHHALEGDPDLVPVRLDLALVLLCAGRTRESLAAYDDGLERALRLGSRAGVVQIALDDLDQVLEERPHLGKDPGARAARERLRGFGDRASSADGSLPMGAT